MDMNQTSQPTAANPAPGQGQDMDISKTTITVLVLLTLMISVIGTWTVLNEISNVKTTQKAVPASAKVSLTLTDRPTPPSTSTVSGHVALRIQ